MYTGLTSHAKPSCAFSVSLLPSSFRRTVQDAVLRWPIPD